MDRRKFLRGMMASGMATAVVGCGGGGGGTLGAAPSSVAGTQSAAGSPAPTPAPVPAPPPAPRVPTLNGITIDSAEADIQSQLREEMNWVAASPQGYHTEAVATNLDELQRAADAAFDTAKLPGAMAMHHRIQCAWNGVASLPTVLGRVNIGPANMATTHYAQGGSVTIVAATGYAPLIANTVFVSGQGIKMAGLGFVRQVGDAESPVGPSAVRIVSGGNQPFEAVVHFENCYFGHVAGAGTMRDFGPAQLPSSTQVENFIDGVVTQGLARFVSLRDCRIWGVVNGAKVVSRGMRVDGCDFSAVRNDAMDTFGHTFTSGYYATYWISRTTIRNMVDTWQERSLHRDAIQYCAASDKHLGIRLLVTDCGFHMAHSFNGEVNMGGGTQGMHGGNNTSLDNQFVLRRCSMMSTSSNTFSYYSPSASRPSFVDRCTFFRAGRTPSNFAPDSEAGQDWATGITNAATVSCPPGEWLLVTDTISKNMYAASGAIIDTVPVDPRNIAAANERPEAVFAGRDFTRGGSPANGASNKFGFDLANEKGSQAAFISDLWANFQPAANNSGRGAPDLRGLSWRG